MCKSFYCSERIDEKELRKLRQKQKQLEFQAKLRQKKGEKNEGGGGEWMAM